MNIKKHIPNAITSGNLVCGCFAIVSAMHNNLVWTAYFVGIALILDYFDGFVARLLKVGGELGKQLDSLADVVTFGVVPGMVIFQMIRYPHVIPVGNGVPETAISPTIYFISLIAFLIPVFSAMRLAIFNIDTRQTSSFIGVPTPANAMLICSLPLIGVYQPELFGCNLNTIIYDIYFLVGLTLVMSYLLVAELPLFALKFKNFKWADNKIRFVFLIISLVLLILFHFIAIPIIIFLYILLSIINNIKNKNEI